MKESKIRISAVTTYRITDCSPELIQIIDIECARRKINSRVELIRQLSGHEITCKKDVKELQSWVKEKGFKTIEKWLWYELTGEVYKK